MLIYISYVTMIIYGKGGDCKLESRYGKGLGKGSLEELKRTKGGGR